MTGTLNDRAATQHVSYYTDCWGPHTATRTSAAASVDWGKILIPAPQPRKQALHILAGRSELSRAPSSSNSKPPLSPVCLRCSSPKGTEPTLCLHLKCKKIVTWRYKEEFCKTQPKIEVKVRVLQGSRVNEDIRWSTITTTNHLYVCSRPKFDWWIMIGRLLLDSMSLRHMYKHSHVLWTFAVPFIRFVYRSSGHESSNTSLALVRTARHAGPTVAAGIEIYNTG